MLITWTDMIGRDHRSDLTYADPETDLSKCIGEKCRVHSGDIAAAKEEGKGGYRGRWASEEEKGEWRYGRRARGSGFGCYVSRQSCLTSIAIVTYVVEILYYVNTPFVPWSEV